MMQDVSWLVDLCRQSIVFEDVDSLAGCLSAIIADREVQVVRVKNRMDLEYNEQQSAGYRDVALNIRIVNERAKQLGLSGHVGEVQLLLKSVAELKVLTHF
jgi:arabinogalactan endo-1,4-beta-galactosidase